MSTMSGYIKTGLTVVVLGGMAYGIVKAFTYVKTNVEVGLQAGLVMVEFDTIATAYPVKEIAQIVIRERFAELNDPSHPLHEETIQYLLKAYDTFLASKDESAAEEPVNNEG